MRPLLLALLLTGCSVADIKGNYEDRSEELRLNARILSAENECAEDGFKINTKEYDRCLDDKLDDEPKLKTFLAKLKNDFVQREVNGVAYEDRQCENLGYYRNTVEYNTCIEYARENKGSVGGRKVSSIR